MKIRVLHVDDDAFTREVTHTALTSFGFEAQAVSSAAEFIAALEEFDPHNSVHLPLVRCGNLWNPV